MQFKEGATAYTNDDERVGTIDRVVIDPQTKEVTHLVIDKGFLFSEDKVVPISLIGPTTDEKVTLREDAGELNRMPDFVESQYVDAGTTVRSVPEPTPIIGSIYSYPPVKPSWETEQPVRSTETEFLKETVQNIPEGTVALKEGAKVISLDGEQVGDIERIFTSLPEEKITHILISEGFLLKEKKLVPANWIGDMAESEVHLLVDSLIFENLPEYKS